VVKEHYLRDDISCGIEGFPWYHDEGEPPLSPNAQQYLILDTNVCLSYIDLIEAAKDLFLDTIVPQTVMQEVKHRNGHIYTRFRKLLADKSRRFYNFSNEHHRETYIERKAAESPNDRNDRAIRVVCQYYKKHLGELGERVLHITNDAASREFATQEGLTAQTMDQFVKSHTKDPEILDRLAAVGATAQASDAQGAKDEYTHHLSLKEVQSQLKTGGLMQGLIRINRDNVSLGRVKANAPGGKEAMDVLLNGRLAVNRAVDGDMVAIQLLPESEWKRPSNKVVEERVADDTDLTDETAAEKKPAAKKGDKVTPCGRVVGIIKRNWRAYAGSLDMESRRGDSYLFVPWARNLPYIRIRTAKPPEELEGKRLVVQIDTWDRTSRYPAGHYVKTLGNIGEREAENEVIFIEHDVPVRPFGPNVLACLPPEAGAYRIREEELEKRMDLRGTGRNICSIDPPGCEVVRINAVFTLFYTLFYTLL